MSDLIAPARTMRIVDRRADPQGRGAVNRERFVRRFKDEIKRAADEEFSRRSITDVGRGGRVTIPGRGLREPFLHHDDESGSRDFVLPGNREYVPGDSIARPPGGGRGDAGGDEPGEGESRDSFAFVLSRDEFLALFFDDLELPNLERTRFGEVTMERTRRAGYSRDGVPGNLSAPMTVRMSIARRIALRGGLAEQIEELERRLDDADPLARAELEREIERLRKRRAGLPFIEDVDRRYRARAPMPSPATRAVMLCLMDVSGSMDERKKDLAKRFFTLLYLFLTRKYERVELVFIRHTDEAEEVDEDTFFYDQRSGGTVVLSALELMKTVVAARFPVSEWNIYAAQASDGDAFGADAGKSARFLREQLLPLARYFAYIETPEEEYSRKSPLWAEYEELQGEEKNFAMKRVSRAQDIYPVFRDLFSKEHAG